MVIGTLAWSLKAWFRLLQPRPEAAAGHLGDGVQAVPARLPLGALPTDLGRSSFGVRLLSWIPWTALFPAKPGSVPNGPTHLTAGFLTSGSGYPEPQGHRAKKGAAQHADNHNRTQHPPQPARTRTASG